jgi:hypothetical protein
MIEVQSGAYLGEDDIVRIEDVYGRESSDRINDVALITGVAGQDGAYLAELLLYKCFGWGPGRSRYFTVHAVRAGVQCSKSIR